MKVLHLNHSDITGGAARAAYRIHHAMRAFGVDSRMLVNFATSGDWTVEKAPRSNFSKVFVRGRGLVEDLVTRTLTTSDSATLSPAIIPSRWNVRLNSSDTDVIHLHWVGGGMISIADIGKINKPVVWTLHDMWPFCGAEHLTFNFRWREGYTRNNRPVDESGFDLNRWTAVRKRRHWLRPLQIVTPSRWLGEFARQSELMRDWPVTVIPNTIDTDVWQPVEKALARQLLFLPPDVPLVLYGAMGGGKSWYKGYDLLLAALNHLRGELPNLRLVIFGQLAEEAQTDIGFPVHYMGHLHDDVSLRLLYCAADVMIIPSRLENLPNTGIEAHACGTPVVAFDAYGLRDIVSHKHTGYLADAYDFKDLANGLRWVLSDTVALAALGRAARARAVERWSPQVVSALYAQTYQMAVTTAISL